MFDVDNTTGLGIPVVPEDDEANSFGYAELFEQIWSEEELIFTIPEADEERFKNGLAVAKTRFNKKLQKEGVAPDNRSFVYTTLASDRPGCIDLQVSLAAKGKIKVFAITKPDPNL